MDICAAEVGGEERFVLERSRTVELKWKGELKQV